jgi:hypothetical protein
MSIFAAFELEEIGESEIVLEVRRSRLRRRGGGRGGRGGRGRRSKGRGQSLIGTVNNSAEAISRALTSAVELWQAGAESSR